MRHWVLLAVLIALSFLCACASSSGPPTPSADHHLHIPSEATASYLQEEADLDVQPKEAEDVIGFLDDAGIEKGTLLSLAYMFGRPGVDVSDEYANVKRENDYVGRQAAKYPERLTAFCSVNPRAEYAIKEIERCARSSPLEGIKLQLANSRVDLRDTSHVHRLAEVFATANRHEMPIVIHLWTGPEYGAEDVEIFIREVLPEAPDVTIQVAHMGGAGMFRASTVEALKVFRRVLEGGSEIVANNVVFDLGAVTANPASARAAGDTARAKRYRETHRQVARWITEIGPDRVVFGSDYFARSVPDYARTLRGLPLEEKVLREVFNNTASYFQ